MPEKAWFTKPGSLKSHFEHKENRLCKIVPHSFWIQKYVQYISYYNNMPYIRRFASFPFPDYPNCPVMFQDTTVCLLKKTKWIKMKIIWS